ncbi:MAG: biotin/lipoyl-binding protein, partial [Dongiaceae bacterium]
MTRPVHLLLLAPAALALLSGCGDDSPAAATGTAPAVEATPVVLGQVEQREFVPQIEGLGTARALESVVVTARVSGRVEEIHFKEGARAKAGQPLVRLEDDEERAALKAAEAEAEQAQSRH